MKTKATQTERPAENSVVELDDSQAKQQLPRASSSLSKNRKQSKLVPPLFTDFARRWFDAQRGTRRESTVRSMHSFIEGRLIPFLGSRRVDQINAYDVNDLLTALMRLRGWHGSKGLSHNTLYSITSVLDQILQDAAKEYGFIAPNCRYSKVVTPFERNGIIAPA